MLTVDDLTRYLDNLNKWTRMPSSFFNKALDKVPHRHLLYKLAYYGVRDTYKSMDC